MSDSFSFPSLVRVRQVLHRAPLPDAEITRRTRDSVAELPGVREIRPGQRIAIGVGSRGIANYDRIVRACVDAVRAQGGEPFLFPAMGSHGGATPAGQIGVLESLGVSEAAMGCPIRATMDVVELGRTLGGLPVYLDAIAATADGILVVNRVKPHTNFHARIESGVMKMLAIGTGKQAQAFAIHKLGVRGLTDHMPEIGRVVMARAPVLGGVAILEDACHATTDVVALDPPTLEVREAELLARVRAWQPSLPVDELDLLIVDRIGKDISGTGMDTKVIGRCQLVDFAAYEKPRIQIIVGLGLTEATHGNAIGCGLCDLVTRRLADAIDARTTTVNVITGQCPKNGAVPPVMDSDAEAIRTALQFLVVGKAPHEATIIRIRDTLSLDTFEVSASLLPHLRHRPGLSIDGDPVPMRFSADGTLS